MTTSNNNTAIGYQALTSGTTGYENFAGGVAALNDCTTGYQNVCIGHVAGYAINAGYGNTFIGANAGDSLTTGDQNVLIGQNNDVDSGDVSNCIGIGHSQTTLSSDTIYIGRSGNQTYKSVTSGTTWTFSSDERIKKDIADENMGLSFINRLQPRSFKWKASQDVPESLTSQYDKDKNNKDTTKANPITFALS